MQSAAGGARPAPQPQNGGRGRRRPRTIFSGEQLDALARAFEGNPRPGFQEREALATKIGVPEARLQTQRRPESSRHPCPPTYAPSRVPRALNAKSRDAPAHRPQGLNPNSGRGRRRQRTAFNQGKLDVLARAFEALNANPRGGRRKKEIIFTPQQLDILVSALEKNRDPGTQMQGRGKAGGVFRERLGTPCLEAASLDTGASPRPPIFKGLLHLLHKWAPLLYHLLHRRTPFLLNAGNTPPPASPDTHRAGLQKTAPPLLCGPPVPRTQQGYSRPQSTGEDLALLQRPAGSHQTSPPLAPRWTFHLDGKKQKFLLMLKQSPEVLEEVAHIGLFWLLRH
ncbi:UNVERIFIED_CONTAM: hypothetical protein K2H54_011935 [Gekko kuhli]